MFTLPDLSYAYNALEPYIDEETMKLHHDKHHATYVKNLNEILAGKEELNKPVEEIISNLDQIPEEIRMKVRNNGGQHANHSLFWEVMTSPAGAHEKPSADFLQIFNSTFGSGEKFQEAFTKEALGRFGSGWIWLVMNKGKLEITSTPNGDSPLMESKTPLLALDVWEHAYYLKYKNMRADYVKAWWNIVNWKFVGERYNKAK